MIFPEIAVTTTPQNLRAALGLDNRARTVTPFGRGQNRGPATIYRTTATIAPDPAVVRGFRHPSGDVFPLTIKSDDLGATWIWTATGTATLVVESGVLV